MYHASCYLCHDHELRRTLKTDLVWKINCAKQARSVYPAKRNTASDLTAVLEICVTPCMDDRTRTCCVVPKQVAFMFPCCREMRCCPDQKTQSRRRTQVAPGGPREEQVSVSVSVTVEETTSSASVYDALLRCLQNPARLDAMCLTGSSGH